MPKPCAQLAAAAARAFAGVGATTNFQNEYGNQHQEHSQHQGHRRHAGWRLFASTKNYTDFGHNTVVPNFGMGSRRRFSKKKKTLIASAAIGTVAALAVAGGIAQLLYARKRVSAARKWAERMEMKMPAPSRERAIRGRG
jgi:virulence family protein